MSLPRERLVPQAPCLARVGEVGLQHELPVGSDPGHGLARACLVGAVVRDDARTGIAERARRSPARCPWTRPSRAPSSRSGRSIACQDIPSMASTSQVAIVGAGTIGIGWAVALSRGGLAVALHDPDAEQLARALDEIAARLGDLEGFELLDEPAAAILARVSAQSDLGSALEGAGYVQECAPESLELKQQLLHTLDELTPPEDDPRQLVLGDHRVRDGRRAARTRALPRRASRQPALPAARRRDRAGAVHGRGRRRAHLRAARRARASRRCGCASSSRASSSTACRARCCARPTRSCATASRRSRTSTASSRTGSGAATASSGRSRPPTSTCAAASAPTPRAWAPPTPAWATSAATTRAGRTSWSRRSHAERRALLPLERWSERVAWRDRALMRLAKARREIEPFPPTLGE